MKPTTKPKAPKHGRLRKTEELKPVLRFSEEEWKTVNELIANPPKPTKYAIESARLAARRIVIRS